MIPFFLLLLLACGKLSASIGVELDVAFKSDSARMQYRHLYALRLAMGGETDTLAVFDSLFFNGTERVSLFYFASAEGKNMLAIVDSAGTHAYSKPFKLSPRRTTFSVVVGQRSIDIVAKDFLYLRKNEEEHSYYVFLLIFFVTKFLITAIFVLASKIPKRNISVSCGAFLLSAFIDWFLPLDYLYRLLMVALAEYLMIALVGRGAISRTQAALLVIAVNMTGLGIIAGTYLLYVFW